ncbi:hypothetical protein HELRODRAFT_174238 [Helobdella robusta]|uniref:Uncharacterized protein n=1 Tax=Helobdella robusta TaxID=6412 RepID=T1F7U9_HELRO|nr:hypothetical protein HELRODRAFT_174238 [Helobdella robusta]ESO02815.1 hypothetical protein HELRODRAFT_174238 [Helobdella robusta]
MGGVNLLKVHYDWQIQIFGGPGFDSILAFRRRQRSRIARMARSVDKNPVYIQVEKSFQTFHALKTLRSHGLRGIKLFDITESLIISRIKYAQQQLQQLEFLIKKLSTCIKSVTQIFNTLNSRLSKKVENNNNQNFIRKETGDHIYESMC